MIGRDIMPASRSFAIVLACLSDVLKLVESSLLRNRAPSAAEDEFLNLTSRSLR
jgi:hypothetical protein